MSTSIGSFSHFMIALVRNSILLALLANPSLSIAQSLPPLMNEGARYSMSIQDPILMQAQGFDWEHQILVALPATYDVLPDKSYPVLWLTDGPGMIDLAVGLVNTLVLGNLAPEMIIVGVGAPSELGIVTFSMRRSLDFAPPGDSYFYEGFAGERLEAMATATGFESPPQQGDLFLDFLVDDVRAELAKTYRFSGDHGLFGHSGGGMFTGYALFARPGDFSKYIIGSPSINASNREVFNLEEAYAADHDDLDVEVFIGAGEAEINDPFMAAWGIVSAPVLMSEFLTLRAYPSLEVTTRIFPGKDHFTSIPDILLEGIQALWGDEVSGDSGLWAPADDSAAE